MKRKLLALVLGLPLASQMIAGSHDSPKAKQARSVTIRHVFATAGSFTFEHNLETRYPGETCFVENAGGISPQVLAQTKIADKNSVSITVSAPAIVTCTFTSGSEVITQ